MTSKCPVNLSLFLFFFFLLLVVGGGLAIGATNLPGTWYLALHKPSFNPPSWIFAPAWTVLYAMIAVAGWRLFRRAPQSLAMRFWLAQLILNFAWSPTVFRAHALSAGLGIILLMDICVAAIIVLSRRKDPVASLLLLPYLAWIAFATTLNGALVALN